MMGQHSKPVIPSGEFDINGDPIPLDSFAGNPGHVGLAPVRPDRYTTLAELRDAYQRGWLNTDAPLILDNNEAAVYDDSGEVFRMHPYVLLEQALELLGIPSEGV